VDRSAACGCVWGGSVAGWMLLVLLINEVDEVYVGKADKKVNGVAFVFSYHSGLIHIFRV
jgi:hypothetical protein